LQGKDEEEPLTQLNDQKLEQAQCYVMKVLGENYFRLCKTDVVSKSMARAMAVISQYQEENLQKFYKGRKHKPLERWPKTTRCWRCMQNKRKGSLRRRTIKKRNKKLYFPQRFTVGA
ncbi:60S ribosomal protein L35, partial [Leptosomus discolor]